MTESWTPPPSLPVEAVREAVRAGMARTVEQLRELVAIPGIASTILLNIILT